MVVTYSPAGKDLYIYLSNVDPGEATRSLPEVPVRMLFDHDHQWIGFEIIELLDDSTVLDLGPALGVARRNAPELTIEHDEKRRVATLRWAAGDATIVLPWDAILDFDAKDQLIGVEFLFSGALEIEGRLTRLAHQRI